MKGIYNRQEAILCDEHDKHLFHRITKDNPEAEIMVLQINIGDIILLPAGQIIKKWKIVSDEDGSLYLGFCKDYHSQTTVGLLYPYKPKKRPRLIYIVEDYLRLRRIKCREEASRIIDEQKIIPIVLN